MVAAIGQGGNLLKILVLNAHIVHQNIKKLEQNLIFVPFEKLFQHRNVAAPFRKLAFRSQTPSPDPIDLQPKHIKPYLHLPIRTPFLIINSSHFLRHVIPFVHRLHLAEQGVHQIFIHENFQVFRRQKLGFLI